MKERVRKLIKITHFPTYLLLMTIFLSCSSYKRAWHEELMQTEINGKCVVILKNSDNIISRDDAGWIEQTYYKPFVRKYNVGDTLFLQNYH